MHVCMCTVEARRTHEPSGAGVTAGCWEPNLDPLKEQNVLLATELPTSPTRGLKFLIFLSARIIIVPLCLVSLSCMYVHMIFYVCMYVWCLYVWGVWSCKMYCLGQFRLKGKMERALEQSALGDGRAWRSTWDTTYTQNLTAWVQSMVDEEDKAADLYTHT